MDDLDLNAIQQEVEDYGVGLGIYGDSYSDTVLALIAEVRRLRTQNERWRGHELGLRQIAEGKTVTLEELEARFG